MNAPKPTAIKLHKTSRLLEVAYADATRFQLPAEYLRVHSPSAEVQGHGQPVLIGGKRKVGIDAVQPVGRYAVRLLFDDGHNTGLFSWEVLWDLGQNQDRYWATYEQRLAEMKMSRDSEVVKLAALQPKKYAPPQPSSTKKDPAS